MHEQVGAAVFQFAKYHAEKERKKIEADHNEKVRQVARKREASIRQALIDELVQVAAAVEENIIDRHSRKSSDAPVPPANLPGFSSSPSSPSSSSSSSSSTSSSSSSFSSLSLSKSSSSSSSSFLSVPVALPSDAVKTMFELCSLEDIAKASSVCKPWNDFLKKLKADPAFLEQCAVQGFGRSVPAVAAPSSSSSSPSSSSTSSSSAAPSESKYDSNRTPGDVVRGCVWKMLTVHESSFSSPSISLASPKEQKQLFYRRLLKGTSSAYHDIAKDVNRTPLFECKRAGQQQHIERLTRLLRAYAVHDREVGYTQGMNFLAAFVSSHYTDEQDAYWTWFCLMQKPKYNLRAFYKEGLGGLLVAKFQLHILIQWYLPNLSKHFELTDTPTEIYTPWILTLFSSSSLPRETVARAWDLFICNGTRAIFQVALALLDLTQDRLMMEDEFGDIFHYLKVS